MSIPTLDEVVLETLEFYSTTTLEPFKFDANRRYLVIASGNALPTGRVIFNNHDAVFCDESSYRDGLKKYKNIDSIVVISASGGKHSSLIIKDLEEYSEKISLITCHGDSASAKLLDPKQVIVTPQLKEPLTYNTSTYLGMMLKAHKEDPSAIKNHIEGEVAPLIADLTKHEAFYLITRSEFAILNEMFVTKFDELFGGRINGRCYTYEQTMHAKTVVPWDKELFISFGTDNSAFGDSRLEIPLINNIGFAGMLAIGYYVIGRLQAQLPPWFSDNVESYKIFQKKLFS